jgi:hypothetical protein
VVGVGDVSGFLDGVAVADPFRFHAQGQHLVQLVDRCDVEGTASCGEQLQDGLVGVRLHRVKGSGEAHLPDEFIVAFGDSPQIDQQKGRLLRRRKGLEGLETPGVVIAIEVEGVDRCFQLGLLLPSGSARLGGSAKKFKRFPGGGNPSG